MKKKINCRILFFLALCFLPINLYAFDTIKNIPERNPCFTGRAAYLNDMQKILQRNGKVYLTGYGGIGKTQLAKEYSYIHEKEYDLIWWFDLKDNLEIQYKNLLTHLSNDKRFTALLHVKTKDIAPNVIIDFTNSLLSRYRCKWLLIFDNASDNKDIKLPIIQSFGQNIIITAREKPGFGNNILTVDPFADYESKQFLFKIHPNEKKEEIYRLLKILHNYPLALAQISEEILMGREGIKAYLSKHNELKIMPMPLLPSNIAQRYKDSYNVILSHTLQIIEQKHKEAANTLYMLVLLKANLSQKLFHNIFGNEFEKELIVLAKHGVLRITSNGDKQILSIHDIIREEALERFNNKKAAYKKEIIHRLGKYINNFYSEKNLQNLLNYPSTTSNQTVPLYAFIDMALENDVIDNNVVDEVIVALKLNHTLFNVYANYILYSELANKIFNKYLGVISIDKKALLYANMVYADSIFKIEQNVRKYENEMLHFLATVEKDKGFENLFVVYSQLSHFYLFLGDLRESEKYIKKAKMIVNYVGDKFSLVRFWYICARVYYELRDVDKGIEAFNNYEKYREQFLYNVPGVIAGGHVRISLKILSGYKNEAKKDLEEAIKNTLSYYNNIPSTNMCYLIYTKALLYFQEGKLNDAYEQCIHAINIAKKIYGEDILDYRQANMHITLGKIYKEKGNYNLGLEEYKKGLKYYDKLSNERVISFYDYGELLSNLCVIYYERKNYFLSKSYFQKLVSNFDLEHKLVRELIQKLPLECIYLLGDKTSHIN